MMHVQMVNIQTENGRTDSWRLADLHPTPEEEWDRLRAFLAIQAEEREGMLASVEPLFRRGHELVVGNYDYLLQHHETAAILGWENRADPEHLAERRRFFTVWLARTLGLDFSHDFARYLFRAGQKHAAHGPRQIHVPPSYVTGAISLVNATFAHFLQEEMAGHPVLAPALAGWNKVLTLHLHLMLHGYRTAREWDEGDFPLDVRLYGRMRATAGRRQLTVPAAQGNRVADVLRKFFNYFPQARREVFEDDWRERERVDDAGRPWLVVEKEHRVRSGWRVLLNGRDVSYVGLEQVVAPDDTVSIFPPGR